ncbi:MAG: glycosyltransferase family 4 protein [Aureliella sp.]
MKIALVITELYPGGAERCFVQLALFLRRYGHEVQVWQLWPAPPPERNHLVETLVAADIKVHSCEVQKPWQFPSAVGQLRRRWRAYQPDIVQAFLFHANFAAALSTPKNSKLFGGARVAQPEQIRQRLQRFSARQMECLVAVSESVAAHCTGVEKIPSEKVEVIPNGINLDQFESRAREEACWTEFGMSADAKVLLFLGRLAAQKGVLPFSDQLESLLDRLPHHEVVFMGDGDQRESLQTRISQNRHARRIRLVGWQANTAKWLSRSECLFLPAVYEGMPNVVLEAMAAAKPFICFNVDGLADLVGDSLLLRKQAIPRGDYARFCNAIVEICNDRALSDELRQANQARIKDAFDLEKQLLKYQELYERFLD